ncbi:MAG: ATPase [Hyphomicrobiales bacterium]|nr:ATPase [Hyphomicrobiales bacterium]
MTDKEPIDLSEALIPSAGEKIDPHELARRDLKKALPKRFYKQAAVAEDNGRFALTLDGRRARTPARHELAVPSRALAERIAAEWAAQADVIDPAAMPVTRIVNSALDGVSREMEAVAAEIVKYAGSDLLCYRAGDPRSLVAEQADAWDPVLAWMRERHGAFFILAEGVMFVEQGDAAMAAVRKAVAQSVGEGDAAPLRLAALNVITTLTGSALLALAFAQGFLSAEETWKAAHVDEDFQIRNWGEDFEAAARRERRWAEMQAAAAVLEGTA